MREEPHARGAPGCNTQRTHSHTYSHTAWRACVRAHSPPPHRTLVHLVAGGIAAPEARGVQLAVLGRGVQRHRHTSARKQARSHTRVIGVCGEDLVTEERRGRGGKVPVEREALVAVLCYCPLGHGETRRQLARCCCCYGRGGAGGAGFCGGSTMEEVSIIHTS